MQSLRDNFDEIVLRLGEGRRLESIGSDPIYYLIFPNREILEVKRETKAWRAKLENKGWQVVTCSMTSLVNQILEQHPLRKTWLLGEQMLLGHAQRTKGPLDFREINKTVRKALTEGTALMDAIAAKLAEAAALPNGLLLITDLEVLHPYLRINSIEAKLQGSIRCPVLILYPGLREGKTGLRFLEFYPADPNYRSEHIG